MIVDEPSGRARKRCTDDGDLVGLFRGVPAACACNGMPIETVATELDGREGNQMSPGIDRSSSSLMSEARMRSMRHDMRVPT